VDYYQGVVVEYLRANRSVFLNTECCIQLNEGNPDTSGPHWYCDALAVDLKKRHVYLCEVSYSKSLAALFKRLAGWNEHWSELKLSIVHNCGLDPHWPVTPWLFIPQKLMPTAEARIQQLGPARTMPDPKITALESTVPWEYPSWNRAEPDNTTVPPELEPDKHQEEMFRTYRAMGWKPDSLLDRDCAAKYAEWLKTAPPDDEQ
jgi:hypothetical protein